MPETVKHLIYIMSTTPHYILSFRYCSNFTDEKDWGLVDGDFFFIVLHLKSTRDTVKKQFHMPSVISFQYSI